MKLHHYPLQLLRLPFFHCVHRGVPMIGKWVNPYVWTILWKCKSSSINQALYLVLKGYTLLDGVPRDATMIGACGVSVATCPSRASEGEAHGCAFKKEERCAESPPMFICGKRRENRRKPVKIKILSLGVIFTFEEGISTSHVCLKGQQPIF